MSKELSELREDAAALARDLAALDWRRAAGLPAQGTPGAAVEAHRLASSADALAQLRESLDPARPARFARLCALRDFCLRARAVALDPGAAQELHDLPLRPSVRIAGDAGLHGARPPLEVERELPFARVRAERAELERALAGAPAGPLGAAFEAAQAALAEARIDAVGLHTRGWNEKEGAAEAAGKLLGGTDAVAGDLGTWLLERHTGARPGSIERHDVLHFLWSPRFASAFPRGEHQRTVRRWADALRLDLGGVRIDDEERPGKPPGARAVALDPPSDVRVAFFPAEGPRALASLLGALGEALLRAGPPEDAPAEDLWFGDGAVPAASAALLGGLARDPGWLRRVAKADLGRDDERALACAAVLDARIAAAATLASLEAHRLGGLSSRAEAAARELFLRATGADLPAGLALASVDPWLAPWAELRGLALAARMRASLRERFDEDWWRNPRALDPLQGLWSRGGRPTAAELWAELGEDLPSVEALVADLLAACG